MGAVFFFEEEVSSNDDGSNKLKCQVEVFEYEGIPEIRIGPVGQAYKGSVAVFDDWDQFERFIDAIKGVYRRVNPLNK